MYLFPISGGSVLGGFGNIYGNNVTYTSTYLPSGAMKSWIDLDTKLPAGRLTKYFLYIHNASSVEAYADLRLQIWRAFRESDFLFSLIWEQEVTVRLDYQDGALYTVSFNVVVVNTICCQCGTCKV